MESAAFSLGLIGYPLQQSLSPRLHGSALQAMGLRGEYRLYPIAPGDGVQAGLGALLDRARRGEIHGLNVTIPHKTAVRAFLDAETSAARAIGAVNTIIACDGRLTGDNTDAPGFIADLQQVFPQLTRLAPNERSALVLGAGGAARAVVFALAQAGWRVVVAARRVDQAAAIAADLRSFQPSFLFETCELSANGIRPHLPDLRLVVNTTPVGMIPDVGRSPWPEALRLPENASCYDLVYKPLETLFVRQAVDWGLPASGGLGMLIEQAALAMERWTGLPVPRDVMRAAVAEVHFNIKEP